MAEPRLTAPLQNFFEVLQADITETHRRKQRDLLNPSATKFVPLDARSGVH